MAVLLNQLEQFIHSKEYKLNDPFNVYHQSHSVTNRSLSSSFEVVKNTPKTLEHVRFCYSRVFENYYNFGVALSLIFVTLWFFWIESGVDFAVVCNSVFIV